MRRFVAAVVGLLCALGLPVPAASADHVGCGALIQSDTTLDSDVTGCTGPALRVAAAPIDLDLGGHAVSSVEGDAIRLFGGGVTLRNGSVGLTRPGCSVLATGPQGGMIRDLDAHDVCVHQASGYLVADLALSGGIGVTESSGTTVRDVSAPSGQAHSILVAYSSDTLVERVRGARMGMWSGQRNTFRDSRIDEYCYSSSGTEHMYLDNECETIQLEGTDDATVVGNTVSTAGSYGITSQYNSGARISRNSVRAGVVGIQLYRSSDGTIERNHVIGAQFGILLVAESERNLLVQNFTNRNDENGIDIRSAGNSVGRNLANHNGGLGINAVAGTIDLGKNKAHGNGNPAQCAGVSCK